MKKNKASVGDISRHTHHSLKNTSLFNTLISSTNIMRLFYKKSKKYIGSTLIEIDELEPKITCH